MAQYSVGHIGEGGGTALHGDAVVILKKLLLELQNTRMNVVTANVIANTDITLTGAAVGDTVIGVVAQDTTTQALAAHAGTVTVTATNTIRSTATTAGKNLLVLWRKH